eukprot:m.162436 g.162436  ORF g.162436 m.162436 type:complete len:142 (-) comp15202_c0_seq3:780-1205(-)
MTDVDDIWDDEITDEEAAKRIAAISLENLEKEHIKSAYRESQAKAHKEALEDAVKGGFRHGFKKLFSCGHLLGMIEGTLLRVKRSGTQDLDTQVRIEALETLQTQATKLKARMSNGEEITASQSTEIEEMKLILEKLIRAA